MKIFRLLGLMIAISWCAAMVLTPLTAVAGKGQGVNQGVDQAQSGTIQANQENNQQGQSLGTGPGPGGNMDLQDSGQNTTRPGQGNRPGMFGNATADAGQQGRGPGNGAMYGNRTMNGPGAGNMTAPPGMPGWNADNATAMGNMTRQHGQEFGNGTAPALPPDWNANNATAMTGHEPGFGTGRPCRRPAGGHHHPRGPGAPGSFRQGEFY